MKTYGKDMERAWLNRNTEIQTYDGVLYETWMNGLDGTSMLNVRHILAAFALLGVPHSYLDVGCGDGAMVNAARLLGVEAWGIDQLVDDKTWPAYYLHRNLVDFTELPHQVELVTCFEVAEHIHESAHNTLCDTICSNLAAGQNYLLFGAARPGQGGAGHISNRPSEYWHQRFIERHLTYDGNLTMNLAAVWSRINSPLNYFYDNLMVFEKT